MGTVPRTIICSTISNLPVPVWRTRYDRGNIGSTPPTGRDLGRISLNPSGAAWKSNDAGGCRGSPPSKLTEDDLENARALLANPDVTVAGVANRLRASPATRYRSWAKCPLSAQLRRPRRDCHIAMGASAKRRRLRNFQAAATAVRHVSIATARSAVRLDSGEMTLDVEDVVDGGMRRQEFLG